MFAKVVPVIDYSLRSVCRAPYPNHKSGCPNYGKVDRCPPKSPLIRDVIDLVKPIFAVWNVFDLGEHINRMKEAHPEWTDRQLKCCLYWQPKARKQLKSIIRDFLQANKDMTVVACPEACGVNLFETMAQIGEILERVPTTKTYQIVLAGSAK